MTKLVEQVKPEQFVSYKALKVAFYDAKNPSYNEKFHREGSLEFNSQFKNIPEYLLYIHIIITNDDRSVINRAAGSVKVPDGLGGKKPLLETVLYEQAYKIYLELKKPQDTEENQELSKLRNEIKVLKDKDKIKKDKE